MTSSNTSVTPALKSRSLLKSALIGGGIGLAVISVFVFGAGNPNPGWGAYWQIKPLLLTPIIAAIGGVCAYLVANLKTQGFLKVLSIIAAVVGFVMAVWIGVVLGLNGTMWD